MAKFLSKNCQRSGKKDIKKRVNFQFNHHAKGHLSGDVGLDNFEYLNQYPPSPEGKLNKAAAVSGETGLRYFPVARSKLVISPNLGKSSICQWYDS